MKTPLHTVAVMLLAGLLYAACDSGPEESAGMPGGGQDAQAAGPGKPDDLLARLESFVQALNADDPSAMLAFYQSGATEAFRNGRSEKEHRDLYARLTTDLGQLKIRQVLRQSPNEVVVLAAAERVDLPVRFVFGIEDERIDALSIEMGGPPGGMSASVLGLAPGVPPSQILAGLDAWLRELAADDVFSGVVLLARDGKVSFHNAYGMADRAAGRINEITTAFDVGSITKLLTRIAVAQLAQRGEIDIDAHLVTYLPDYPDADAAARISIRHLLDHSSGLGDFFNEAWRDADKSLYRNPRDFFPLFAGKPLAFEPGSRRAYSNAGFVVLGAVIEAVSGRGFADYLAANIFAPADMTRSGMLVHDGRNPGLAIGYTRRTPGSDPAPNTGMLPLAGCPAGSSTHTAEDLFRLDQALRSGRLLNPEWTAWVYTGHAEPQPPGSYSLGVAGGGPGVSAAMETSGPLSVVVLSNLDPPAGEALARELFEALGNVPDA